MDGQHNAETPSIKGIFAVRKHPVEIVFGAVIVLITLLLLVQIPGQVKFFDGLRLFAQPGTWPVMALVGMLVFGIPYLVFAVQNNRGTGKGRVVPELWFWCKALEFPLWFLAYVWLVPYSGYLPATLLFCPVLTWRLGYHNKKMLLLSLAAAGAIVLLFKSFLQVKIPGGMVYEVLPAAMRNFMIINF